jgi:anti-sigma factor ChrR (cupin superfamily)
MFIAKDDPDFWKAGPEFLQAIKQQAEAYGLKVANFMMGAQQDDQAPVATVMYMPPNFVLPRHAHDCYRVEVIVQGSVDTGDRVLHVGDVMVSAPNEFYGPHTAGPEGSLSVEIFSRAKAQQAIGVPSAARE